MRKFKLLRKNGKSAACQNLRLFGEILIDKNFNMKVLSDLNELQRLIMKKAEAQKTKTPRRIRKKYDKSNTAELRLDVKINLGKMQMDFTKRNF